MAKIATKTISNGTLTITFTNGTVLTISRDDLSEKIIFDLCMHGLSQKVGDSYASATSLDEAIAAASVVIDNLKAGRWATKTAGGRIVEALSRATSQPQSECLIAWQKMGDKEKAALRKHPGIKKALANIAAEVAAAAAQDTGVTAPDLSELFPS